LRKDDTLLSQPSIPLRAIFSIICAAFGLLVFSQTAALADTQPRVSIAYTAWDDYYFYAAFEVNDTNVISVNRTPISQPQEDDDVEVFIDKKPGDSSKVRTPDTYQMAVSAGSGAYFSVGDGTKIPKGKLVLTYKYAVTIDGTLNNPTDNDTGFTVEFAIPWKELGMTGPPADGQIMDFNEISRNRDALDTPAKSFVSLSPNVLSESDVQDPSTWTKIQFISTLANQVSGPGMVYCPRIVSQTNYPMIDGVVRSGEWNTRYGYSFGQTLIAGNAPIKDEEPNVTESPFATTEQPVIQTPQTATAPPATTPTPPDSGYTLSLPGGGEIHVGKLQVPPPQPYVPPAAVVGQGHHKYVQYPGSLSNPLAPNLPPDSELSSKIGPTIDSYASLALLDQKSVPPLILAVYRCYDSDVFTADQPEDGLGPVFGASHSQWDRNQVADARRAGIDVLLPIVNPADPKTESGLAALVQALKEMKAAGDDYPLLGVKIEGDNPVGSVREFLTIVPEEFRAETILPDNLDNQRAYIAFADTLPDVTAIKDLVTKEFNSANTIIVTTPAGKSFLHIDTVSPGGWDSTGAFVDRSDTQTLSAAWEKVDEDSPNWVYIDSWNDYQHGNEVAASRQYGEQYADLTRISALKWSGADQWDAKYLQSNVPDIIAQKTIYTVSIRVENNGSLPWRVGEGYSLCYRWYKDGRLFDDSAPRLPLDADVFPGQSTTINVGVVAQNSFGTAIDPGRYTLVFDMVQGQSRWFSYVGSQPLRIPVRVEDTIDAPQTKATVISSTTPSVLDSTGTYTVAVDIQNEGQEIWKPDDTSLSLLGNRADGKSSLNSPVYPGAVGRFTIAIRVPADQETSKIASLVWTIKTPGSTSSWTEHPFIVRKDFGNSFTLNDIPRTVKSGQKVTSRIALLNTGPYSWVKGAWKINYEWLYLDGTPAIKGDGVGNLETNVEPGIETGVSLDIQAPDYPGKYQLVLGIQSPDGFSSLDESTTRATAMMPMIVSVTADKNADAQTVDLSKYFNGAGVGFERGSDPADFDGSGDSLPAAYLPPDETQELDVNPLLVGKTGPPEYPSGYYTSTTDSGLLSNHRIAFLYAAKDNKNFVACSGQQIDLPDGNWKAIHILTASTGIDNVIAAPFVLGYKDGDVTTTLQIANWTKIPSPVAAGIAIRLPFMLKQGSAVPTRPVFLGDYLIATDHSRGVRRLTLPTDPRIKVLAITVEK
jgi:hypothetical protein